MTVNPTAETPKETTIAEDTKALLGKIGTAITEFGENATEEASKLFTTLGTKLEEAGMGSDARRAFIEKFWDKGFDNYEAAQKWLVDNNYLSQENADKIDETTYKGWVATRDAIKDGQGFIAEFFSDLTRDQKILGGAAVAGTIGAIATRDPEAGILSLGSALKIGGALLVAYGGLKLYDETIGDKKPNSPSGAGGDKAAGVAIT